MHNPLGKLSIQKQTTEQYDNIIHILVGKKDKKVYGNNTDLVIFWFQVLLLNPTLLQSCLQESVYNISNKF